MARSGRRPLTGVPVSEFDEPSSDRSTGKDDVEPPLSPRRLPTRDSGCHGPQRDQCATRRHRARCGTARRCAASHSTSRYCSVPRGSVRYCAVLRSTADYVDDDRLGRQRALTEYWLEYSLEYTLDYTLEYTLEYSFGRRLPCQSPSH